jgi:O-antigen ligase/tetratricopeptide (TPR) repeat protein
MYDRESIIGYNLNMTKEKIKLIIDKCLEANVLLIVFFVPLYFAIFQENFSIFELNKIVLFRIGLLLLIVLFCAKFFLARKINTKVNAGFFIFAVLALLLFFISSYFSLHPKLSFWGSYARQQGYYSLFSYGLFFCFLLFYFDSFKKIKRVILTIIASSVIACIYGLIQYFYLDPLDWKEATILTGRVFSTLGQPNFFGNFLLLALPFSAYAFFCLTKNFFCRFFLVVAICLQLACLAFTYSRAAYVGFAAGLFIFLIFWLVTKNKKRLSLALTIFGFIICVTVIISSVFYTQRHYATSADYALNFASRIKSNLDLSGGSIKMRLLYWQAAVEEIKAATPERLLIGFGPETLSTVFSKYYTPEWGIYEKVNSYPDRAHNIIFDIILTYGLAGLLLLLSFIAYLLLQILKYTQNKFCPPDKKFWLVLVIVSLLAGHFANLLFTFATTTINVYIILILSILIFLISQENKEKIIALRLSKLSRLIIFPMVLIVCFLFIYYQNINEILADYYYMQVKLAEKDGNCSLLLADMEKVINYSPARTFYQERYLHHYLSCFAATDSQTDRNTIHDNLVWMLNNIEPQEYQFYTILNMAHAESLLGYFINPAYYSAAEKNYLNLVEFNRFFAGPAKDLAKMKLWQGDYEQAIKYAQQAIKALPALNHPKLNNDHAEDIKKELIEIYDILAAAYSGQKNNVEALAAYQSIIKMDPRHLPIYKKIADIYYQQGNLKKAIFYNQRGHMLNPRDYNWPYAMALLYQERGDKQKARDYANQALNLNPDNQKLINFINEL